VKDTCKYVELVVANKGWSSDMFLNVTQAFRLGHIIWYDLQMESGHRWGRNHIKVDFKKKKHIRM